MPTRDASPGAAPSSPSPLTTDKSSPGDDGAQAAIGRQPSQSSTLTRRLSLASKSFEESGPPEGFLAAAGEITSSILAAPRAPTAATSRPGPAPGLEPNSNVNVSAAESRARNSSLSPAAKGEAEPAAAAPFPNGYHFPPKHSFGESVKLGAVAFWHWFITPLGFFVTIYGLNVVAWGGMLFLLLCGAAPSMCHPSCNDINSPRRKWIEIDSQILNALFCVTGFGLAPWRFRDLYFLLQYRLRRKELALRRLAGIHRTWFRLAGSDDLPIGLSPDTVNDDSWQDISKAKLPHPLTRMPDAPLTGVRAQPTKIWKLDLVIWLMVWNTLLQIALAGLMWGMNRHERPSWTTGLLIGLGMGVACIAGIIMFLEGKKVKGIEGVAVSERDQRRLARDREQGIWHYNNIKGKDLTALPRRKRRRGTTAKSQNRTGAARA